jgi:hypothetical protein
LTTGQYRLPADSLTISTVNHSLQLTDLLTAKLLLALASTVILDAEFHGIHDFILLPHGSASRQATNGRSVKLLLVFASTVIPNSPFRSPIYNFEADRVGNTASKSSSIVAFSPAIPQLLR